MLLTEYDAKKHEKMVRRDAKAEGVAEGKLLGITEGKALDILELLELVGPVPEQLRKRIMQEQNLDTLKKWHKLSAKAESLEEFIEKME